MKLDVAIRPSGDLRYDVERIQRAEALGFDAVWVSESARNPFLLLTVAAAETEKILLGTRIALAFPRSPMVTAQIAWDLARQSEGRFMLGLGSQTREHIEGRFSEEWRDPMGRMREYVESLRAIWDTFQTGARLRYRGEHYQFRLMAPFFNPGPNDNPAIPVFLGSLNPLMCQLAGETCDGLHAHPYHAPAYLREVVLPAVETGLRRADRARSDFVMTAQAMLIVGESDNAKDKAALAAREKLALYARDAGFRAILARLGWGEAAERLDRMARAKRWGEMKDAISRDILHEFAIIAEPDDAFARVVEHYEGLADRVCLEWDEGNTAGLESIAWGRRPR